jgi:hypothetical protein
VRRSGWSPSASGLTGRWAAALLRGPVQGGHVPRRRARVCCVGPGAAPSETAAPGSDGSHAPLPLEAVPKCPGEPGRRVRTAGASRRGPVDRRAPALSSGRCASLNNASSWPSYLWVSSCGSALRVSAAGLIRIRGDMGGHGFVKGFCRDLWITHGRPQMWWGHLWPHAWAGLLWWEVTWREGAGDGRDAGDGP